jgi:hypothetical protein
MLFQAVMNFLSRLVEFKILVNWGIGSLANNQVKFKFPIKCAGGNNANIYFNKTIIVLNSTVYFKYVCKLQLKGFDFKLT